MSTLNDTFWLGRANRYTNPLNTNDRLPIVYGDLTDGSNGIWRLPCIDTVNHVYCFADHEVLSAANGNSINIYADGTLVDPGNYTFDESNDYESEGNIAIITFTATQGNSIVSARGKGKSSGATLIEGIDDIVYDFLTVENSWTSSIFEATARARVAAMFTAQSYKAAGVICKDINIWDLLQEMMGSFLGSVYLNAEKELVLEIDDNTSVYTYGEIVPAGEIIRVTATQSIDNLINQCPATYQYNYVDGEFKGYDSGATTSDAASQNIYSTQEPTTPYQFYWCRDTTSVNTVQGIIVDKFKNPVWDVEFTDTTEKRIHVDVGDCVAVALEDIYDEEESQLINQLIKITSVKPDYRNNTIKFRGIDTGLFMTIAYLADGSWIADGSHRAGGDRDTTIY